MITITLNANSLRKTLMEDADTKVCDFLAKHNLNRSVTPIYLDGAPITDTQAGKTFKELGIDNSCVISSIVKTNNA